MKTDCGPDRSAESPNQDYQYVKTGAAPFLCTQISCMLSERMADCWRVTTMKRFYCVVALLLALIALPAQAGIILDTVDGGQYFDTRNAESAILTYITVGGSDVQITNFGPYGQMMDAGNAKWLIFDGVSDSLLYESAPVAFEAASGPRWYISPALSYTLAANQSYYLGLIADVAFSYGWEYPGYSAVATEESANGLTAPLDANGNAVNFASPVWDSGGSVQQ
jgi:hypothetical protein